MKFSSNELKNLWAPDTNSSGEDNGQVTIIGGSSLFTGAPLFSLVAASHLVDMVFLATPEEDKTLVNKVKLFSKLKSVIWIPRDDLDDYIKKSDAVLIGPGLMRFHKETAPRPAGKKPIYDQAGTETKMLTKYLLGKFPGKKWVIDGGSLQTMEPSWIPAGSVLTPNSKEFELLFGQMGVEEAARKYHCVIVYKGPRALVTDGQTSFEIDGGNAGLTKGGTGDVLAGIIVGLLAKNTPLISAAAGSFVIKKTAEHLFEQFGYNFNADDVASQVFAQLKSLTTGEFGNLRV